MDKYYAQEKRVFDINKVTVVGNPTITSGGVASGLDRTNYVRTTAISFTETDTWEMKLSFIINSNTQGSFTLLNFEGANYRRIFIYNNTISFQFYTTQDYYILIPLVLGAKYDCKWGWDGAKLYCKYSIDGGEEILVSTNLDTGYAIENKRIFLGFSYVQTNNIIEGSIDLKQFSITVDGKEVCSPTKAVYALERRKPKVWNKGQFTVVGNPSISDDGIASGFSASNYIRVPYRPLGQNFKIFTPKFNSSNVSQQQKIVRYSDGNIRIEIYQNKIRLFRYSGNNVYDLPKGETTLQNNTDYYYYVEQTTDGTNYYLKGYISTDNKNWTLDINKTYTSAMYDYQNNAPIQISGADASQPFIGTLDLKQFKIYTDNNLVFDGGAETYVYDPSKFTVVGTPTITEYGVASGFDGKNYLISPKPNVSKCYDFEFISPIFTLNEFPSGNYNIVLQAGTRTISTFINIFVYGQSITANVRQNGTDIFRAMTNYLRTNTQYQVKFIYKNNQWEAYLKESNGEFVIMQTTVAQPGYDENGVAFDSDIKYGNENTTNYLRGSIDLTQLSITADGKEVFTGAKEKFYAMRGM